jgi:hypothetical protein
MIYNRPDRSRAFEIALQQMDAAAERIAQSFGPNPAPPYRGHWTDVTPTLRMLHARAGTEHA